jgi:hypothetical protein
MKMSIWVVISSRVGYSVTSSCSWYRTHIILTNLLNSVNVDLTTAISIRTFWYPLSHCHLSQIGNTMGPHWVSLRWLIHISKLMTGFCISELKKTAHNLDDICCWPAFTDGHKAVQKCRTQHNKFSIPLYSNAKLDTLVGSIAKTWNQIGQFASNIELLTLSLWRCVSDIEFWTWSDRQHLTSTWEIWVYQ